MDEADAEAVEERGPVETEQVVERVYRAGKRRPPAVG